MQAAKLLGAGRVVAADRARRAPARPAASAAPTRWWSSTGRATWPRAIRDAAGGEVDVTIDMLWGAPALAAMRGRRRGARHVEVGQHRRRRARPCRRRSSAPLSLDVRGFSVAHPPLDVKREAYLRLTEHAARGDIVVDVERVPLDDVAAAWERQRRAAGGPKTGPRPRDQRARKEPSEHRRPHHRARPPVVLRGGTVLTMNDAHDVLDDADVLVVGERIEASGPGSRCPEGTFEIDASGGIVMPGMIDTHRHMWQTALRGYGADWTLTPVLRLVLPRVGQDLPARRTSTPATCCRRSSRSTPA